MKKRIVAVMLAGMLAVSATACGGSEGASDVGQTSSQEESEPEYVDNIKAVASDPDAYAGKYIKFSGVASVADESDDSYGLQVYLDPNYNDSVLVEVPKDLVSDPISADDYVSVDARIEGSYDGQTVMGANTTWAYLTAVGIEKTTYMDAFAPTVKELTPNVSSEQNGVSVNVDKVEYADMETRVYLTVSNNSEDNVSYGVYSARLIQDGQQIEQDQSSGSAYMGDYPELSYDVTAGASTSGVLVFPVIDQTKDFQVIVPDVYSDNYELEFSDFALDISVQ